jgi:competence protein ComEA
MMRKFTQLPSNAGDPTRLSSRVAPARHGFSHVAKPTHGSPMRITITWISTQAARGGSALVRYFKLLDRGSAVRWGLRTVLAIGAFLVLTALGHRASRAALPGSLSAASPAMQNTDTAALAARAEAEHAEPSQPAAVVATADEAAARDNVVALAAVTIEASPPHGERATVEHPVFVNEATLDDLERLPGVGPKKAAGILQLRARLGRFHRVEDLLRVKGIGPKALAKIRPLVRLDLAGASASAHDAGRD